MTDRATLSLKHTDEAVKAAKPFTRTTAVRGKDINLHGKGEQKPIVNNTRNRKVKLLEEAHDLPALQVPQHEIVNVELTKRARLTNYTASPYGPKERHLSKPDKCWRAMQSIHRMRCETAALLRTQR